MLGIIIQLAISWLIVWLFEKGDLSFLGMKPTRKRLKDFAIFFFIAALCSASTFLLRMLIAKQHWQLNPDANWSSVLSGVWFVVKSVIYEELIFRGVLFYILIKKLGTTKAILISSAAFGIYHWFSHQVLGNPLQMLITFIITGLAGVVYAYGYAKTFSLYISIALHLGWNLVNMVVFSNSIIGKQLLIKTSPDPVVTISYFSYYLMQFLPLICFLGLNGWLLWRKKNYIKTEISFEDKQRHLE